MYLDLKFEEIEFHPTVAYRVIITSLSRETRLFLETYQHGILIFYFCSFILAIKTFGYPDP